MKKVLKKIVSSLVVVSVLMVSSVSSFAATNTYPRSLSNPQKDIVKVMKNTKDSDQFEAAFKQILSTKDSKLQMQKNPTTINIDDNTKIAFKEDGSFIISKLKTTEKTNSISAMATTVNYTNTSTSYGILGNKLYSIKVTGYFTGTKGSMPVGHLVDAYYETGTLSMWQVSNWEKGASKDGTKAYVFGRGNFSYGYNNNGINIFGQNIHENVYVACDSNFKIYFSK